MSQWGNNDNAANSPLWVATQVKMANGVTTNNQTILYNNVRTSAITTGANVGVFGVSATETANALSESVAHAGWTLRTEGTGGRAGRVHHEVLVAISSITGDAAGNTDNTYFSGI